MKRLTVSEFKQLRLEVTSELSLAGQEKLDRLFSDIYKDVEKIEKQMNKALKIT